MTKEQFITLLRTPATINLNMVKGLEEITERFPYFQNAHLLLAKQYQGHQNIRYESYLRKAAAYAPDRSVLYELIQLQPDKVIHLEKNNDNQLVNDLESANEKVTDPVNELISEKMTQEVSEPDEVHLFHPVKEIIEPVNEVIVDNATEADVEIESEITPAPAKENIIESINEVVDESLNNTISVPYFEPVLYPVKEIIEPNNEIIPDNATEADVETESETTHAPVKENIIESVNEVVDESLNNNISEPYIEPVLYPVKEIIEPENEIIPDNAIEASAEIESEINHVPGKENIIESVSEVIDESLNNNISEPFVEPVLYPVKEIIEPVNENTSNDFDKHNLEEVSELEFENKSLTFEREENSEENIVAEESNSGNEEIDADPISYQAKSSEKVISADEDKEVKRESTPEEILANRLRELSNREPEEAALNESSIDETVEKEIEWPETTATGNEEIEVPEFIRVRRDSREARLREQELKRENEQHTFLDWLKIKDIPVIPTDKISEYFKKEELTDAGSDKVGDALIDQFIKTEPRIVPARSEFYSPGNMARQSAVDHEELISETLARIYAQQGNIPKAIEAYKRLSLKSPEKSSYFAALIRELEQKES